MRVAQEPVSLETPIGEEEDSHLGDFIPDDDAPAPADAASATLLKEELAHVLKTLTPREERVLSMRFGLTDGHPHTLEEVGKEFNVTRERIRMIEDAAFSGAGPLEKAVVKLSADEKLLARFRQAYPDGLTADNVVDAIVQHCHTLISGNMPFDAYCGASVLWFEPEKISELAAISSTTSSIAPPMRHDAFPGFLFFFSLSGEVCSSSGAYQSCILLISFNPFIYRPA